MNRDTPGTLTDLLALDGRRLGSALRYPSVSTVVGIVLPVALLLAGLLLLGTIGVPSTEGAGGGLTLGMLVSGAVSFASYSILLGGADTAFLRRLGISGADLYLERTLRLLLLSVVAASFVGLPYLVAGVAPWRAVGISVVAAVTAACYAAASYAGAALQIIRPRAASGGGGMRQFDPELARAAPLVYAPILPFLFGSGAGAAAGGGVPFIGLIVLAFAVSSILLARLRFSSAAPRFLPMVDEMKFVPPPEKGGESFSVGRGISALLPRRAAAVWVRDSVVGGRRFPWASRVTWPVVLLSFFALARWGTSASTQSWVIAAVAIALLVQGAAIVGLGLHEKGGAHWIDRMAGIPTLSRFVGRWSWGIELSLWLLVPVALAWGWWTDRPGAWIFPAAGVVTAGIAALLSLAYSNSKG